MEFKDYYQTLGVAREASQDEVKRAYRKLARKYHPDVSTEQDAEDRFKEVQEAYEVLKDPEKRAAYDQFGANWKAGQGFEPPPGWDREFEFSGAGQGDFSDFFETLFGRGGPFAAGGGFHAPGEDHHATIEVSLEDAYHGASRNITLRVPELDSRGRVRTVQRELRVKIPKGVKPGQRIRLAGQGAPGHGSGAAGDLYLQVELAAHPRYRLVGNDLEMDLPVTPWEAALGAKVTVPTLGGRVDLTVPAGTQSGSRLRLKGRGIGGDLLAVVKIMTPRPTTDAQRELYRRMAQEMPMNPRAAFENG